MSRSPSQLNRIKIELIKRAIVSIVGPGLVRAVDLSERDERPVEAGDALVARRFELQVSVRCGAQCNTTSIIDNTISINSDPII